MRRADNRAWLLVLPVVAIVAFSAVIPLMTVVNYSVQEVFDVNTRYFVGFDWYRQILREDRLLDATLRQLGFSALVITLEIPLGIVVARALPSNRFTPFLLLLIAMPLLVPWNVVGTVWQMFTRPDIGPLGAALNAVGWDFNFTQTPAHAWTMLVLMDLWHWTSLVVLLCFAGFQAVPKALYDAAAIDGASSWQVFRLVELPRLKPVLIIAVLLRLMDSLMIYTEPFVATGGGPGNSTTFLSQYLTTMAVGQFDVGPAAAFSVVYFLLILSLCWAFYTAVAEPDDG